ncbi:uncharacterized protein LOC143214797 isoform X3 [Lasioglossum baleicum]|uniref:uncharacterized protein LOC143214797 isoform X3 n=1 Tax=Lasioglossum baleicum TaxID=434251 RepID=UPI003FCE674D
MRGDLQEDKQLRYNYDRLNVIRMEMNRTIDAALNIHKETCSSRSVLVTLMSGHVVCTRRERTSKMRRETNRVKRTVNTARKCTPGGLGFSQSGSAALVSRSSRIIWINVGQWGSTGKFSGRGREREERE